MTTKETIDKLIEKYEAKISANDKQYQSSTNSVHREALLVRMATIIEFLTDLKELKNTL